MKLRKICSMGWEDVAPTPNSPMQNYINALQQSVADPGFPRRGTPTNKGEPTYYLTNFPPKTGCKWRHFVSEGGARDVSSPSPHTYPPMAVTALHSVFIWIDISPWDLDWYSNQFDVFFTHLRPSLLSNLLKTVYVPHDIFKLASWFVTRILGPLLDDPEGGMSSQQNSFKNCSGTITLCLFTPGQTLVQKASTTARSHLRPRFTWEVVLVRPRPQTAKNVPVYFKCAIE